jgi:uncharacterized protein YfaT (DUF1175 family)
MKWLTVLLGAVAASLIYVPATRQVPAQPKAPSPPGDPLSLADSYGDGTPDFLRLTDPADRAVFRGWFTFLAESLFLRDPEDLPTEASDCAGLVRFAYRESLREHDGEWAGRLKLAGTLPLGSIRKYRYPHTPLRAALFRIRPGAFERDELQAGFAEFADAETLMRYNTFPVSRRLADAQPGDLLFFHQEGQRFPYHVMVFLGDGVVYHTGPGDGPRGEVRRPALDELRRHPSPRWRPLEGNAHFLGVFRWNILRDSY